MKIDDLFRLMEEDDPNRQFGTSVSSDWEPDDPNDRAHNAAMKKTGFWGARGAGCLPLCRRTGRFLIAHRSRRVEQPGTWGTWGGAIDIDSPETPEQSAVREMREECGYRGTMKLLPIYVFQKFDEDDELEFQYNNFLAIVDDEFNPQLGWETQGYEWCAYGQWPSPLHFGLKAILNDPQSIQTMKAVASQRS